MGGVVVGWTLGRCDADDGTSRRNIPWDGGRLRVGRRLGIEKGGVVGWEELAAREESQSISHFCLSLLELQIHARLFFASFPRRGDFSLHPKTSPHPQSLLVCVVRHLSLPTSIVKRNNICGIKKKGGGERGGTFFLFEELRNFYYFCLFYFWFICISRWF
jgi:hypothetical protein